MSKTESVTVFENLSDNIITFNSKEQFMNYYDKNKETIDNMKTRGLNTKFKIDGYRIGRKNNILMLFPTKVENKDTEQTSVTNTDDLHEEIQDLRERIDSIGALLNKLLKQFSKLNQDNQSPSSYTSGVVDIFGRTPQNSYR